MIATITSIKPLTKDPLRCGVHVGRRRVATLSRQQVERLDLSVGTVWDDALAKRVMAAAAYDHVRRDAMRRLNRRAMSAADLRTKLRDKGHEVAHIDTVIDELTQRGLLNDEAFGRTLIEMERRRKPAGRQLLRQKLRQHGLAAPLIQQLLDDAQATCDPVADARRLASRRLASPTLQRCDAATRRRRLWGMLARRGFEPDVIRQALSNLLDETHCD